MLSFPVSNFPQEKADATKADGTMQCNKTAKHVNCNGKAVKIST